MGRKPFPHLLLVAILKNHVGQNINCSAEVLLINHLVGPIIWYSNVRVSMCKIHTT